MHVTLRYRPGDGITSPGEQHDHAPALLAAGMRFSARQGSWYAPGSHYDHGRAGEIAAVLRHAGHAVELDEPANDVTDPRRTPPARAHRRTRAAAAAPARGPVEAVRAEVIGLTLALQNIPAHSPALPRLEARLDRARGRLDRWTSTNTPTYKK